MQGGALDAGAVESNIRPYVTVSKSSDYAREGQGPFTISLSLSSRVAAPISVYCSTPIEVASAVPDVDFIPVSSQTVTWDAYTLGTKTCVINIPNYSKLGN